MLSSVQLFATPWTGAWQAPHPWNFPGKNAEVGCHFLLQWISPTQGSNLVSYIFCIIRWIISGILPTALPGREGERDRPEEREYYIAGEYHLIYERGIVLIFENHFVTPEVVIDSGES